MRRSCSARRSIRTGEWEGRAEDRWVGGWVGGPLGRLFQGRLGYGGLGQAGKYQQVQISDRGGGGTLEAK